MSTDAPLQTKQNDSLLWLAGALVVGIGIVWLLMAAPWSSPGSSNQIASSTTAPVAAAPTKAQSKPAAAAPSTSTQTTTATNGTSTSLTTSLGDKPLRMAELAYEAGMLVEPEDYSAWALYRKVLVQQPENVEAKQGLDKIATELLRRANVALEQGRYDDARKTAERIQTALPDNLGARELAAMVDKLAPKPEPVPVTPAPTAKVVVTDVPKPEAKVEPKPAPAPPPPVITLEDRVRDAHDGFAAAMAADKLLAPPNSSAKHFVGILLALAPSDARSKQDRGQLFDQLLARADKSLTQKDTTAASTWIDEAGALGVDSGRVTAARNKVNEQLIAIESARRMPITTFEVVKYQPPEYPERALRRGVDGWVDVEFTVAADGHTQDIVVTDAKNEDYFKDAAVNAVSRWRFKPHVFMNRTIPQRTYTRINFTFDSGPSR